MSDALKIWGTDYTGVKGFKAKDANNNQYAYVRPQGAKSITENGTGIDVSEYATVNVNVSGGGNITIIETEDEHGGTIVDINGNVVTLELQDKTVTPSTTTQEITADTNYDGLNTVTVNPIPSQYIIPSGTKSITQNGTGIDVAEYATVDVNVSGGGSPTLQSKTVAYTPTTSQQTDTVTADSGYDGLSSVSVTVNAVSSGTEGTPTATKGTVSNHSISVTPSVTNTTGYIAGGTKTGTAVTVTASELASGNKAISSNGTGIDVVGYSTVSVSVPTGTARNSSDLTVSGATVNVPAGLYSSAASKTVASGSATTPATTVTALIDAEVTSSGQLRATASGSESVTPTVVEGYVSEGTAGTITVSGGSISQLPTLAAQTVTPNDTTQTIGAAGRWTLGSITINPIPANRIDTSDATAAAGDIISGKSAYVDGSKVNGSLVIQHYYTGSSAPSSSLGSNGDIYLQTGG